MIAAPGLTRLLARRRLPAALVAAAALGLAGCGGDQVEYQEVPGGPAEIQLPRSPALQEQEDETPNQDQPAEPATPEEAPEESPTPPEESPTPPEEEAPTTPPADGPATEPQAQVAPGAGGGTESRRFQEFCEQNPGAC